MHDNLRKRCSYCGRLYPVETEVCSLDGQPLGIVPKPEPPPLPGRGNRNELILGFVGGVLGFFILLFFNWDAQRVHYKLIMLMVISLVLGIVCLLKLLEPLTDRLIESPPESGDNPAPAGSSSAGPLRCTYCGKRHPEGTEVCDLDGQPLRRV